MIEAVNNKNIEAVVFDLDGTLTPGNSWTDLTRDLGGSVLNHLEIFGKHISGEASYEEARGQLTRLWQATGNANRDCIKSMYESWPIRPEANPLIGWLKQNDFLVCLITGSTIDYAEHIAKRLGVEDYFASAGFMFDENGDLTDFYYVLDQAAAKTEHLDIFCSTHAISPQRCLVVGDSGNDVDLFNVTGNGLLLGDSQNESLVRAASKRISTLTEVIEVLRAAPTPCIDGE